MYSHYIAKLVQVEKGQCQLISNRFTDNVQLSSTLPYLLSPYNAPFVHLAILAYLYSTNH